MAVLRIIWRKEYQLYSFYEPNSFLDDTFFFEVGYFCYVSNLYVKVKPELPLCLIN
jgi:hypothetical protein